MFSRALLRLARYLPAAILPLGLIGFSTPKALATTDLIVYVQNGNSVFDTAAEGYVASMVSCLNATATSHSYDYVVEGGYTDAQSYIATHSYDEYFLIGHGWYYPPASGAYTGDMMDTFSFLWDPATVCAGYNLAFHCDGSTFSYSNDNVGDDIANYDGESYNGASSVGDVDDFTADDYNPNIGPDGSDDSEDSDFDVDGADEAGDTPPDDGEMM